MRLPGVKKSTFVPLSRARAYRSHVELLYQLSLDLGLVSRVSISQQQREISRLVNFFSFFLRKI